jgi:alpha-tubulin suppressor-like RCC1 family protein
MKKGISLIVLVITIIVIIILATTVILSLSTNNPIQSAEKAVLLSNIDTIKSDVTLYISAKMVQQKTDYSMFPILLGSDLNPIHPIYDEIDTSSKIIIAKAQEKYLSNGLPDVYNIDLQKVYVVDSNVIGTSKKYVDNILIVDKGYMSFELLFKNGISISNQIMYSLGDIDFEKTGDPQFFAIGNNTFKLTASGSLSALGEKNSISGASQTELNFLNLQWKEFNKTNILSSAVNYTLSYGTAYIINNVGDLYAIGDNTDNKLGLGNSYLQQEAVKIVLPESAKAKTIYGGPRNTWIIDTNNNVWAAGSNTLGEMGLNNTTSYTTFQKIAGLDGSIIKNIYVSDNYYCRSTMIEYINGDVTASGDNSYGNWGCGNTASSYVFKNVSVEWKKNLSIAFPIKKMISGNLLVTGLLDSNDTLWVCGYNNEGRLGNGNKIAQSSFIRCMDNVKDFDIQGNLLIENKTGQIYKTSKVIYNETTMLDEYFSEKIEVLNVPAGAHKLVRSYSVFDSLQNKNITKPGAISCGGKVYYIEEAKTVAEPPKFVEDTLAPANITSIDLVRGMLTVTNSSGKVFLYNNNSITAIGSNIQQQLKPIKYGQNIAYITGYGNDIHLVDAEYRLWTDLTTTVPKLNVVKSIVTRTNQYMLLNTGDLYSKGYSESASYGAGGWGTNDAKSDFVLIQQNVKGISACDGGAISITNDNKVYAWGQVWSQFLNVVGYNSGTLKVPTLLTGTIQSLSIKSIDFLSSNGGTPQTATYISTTDGSIYAYGVYGYTGLTGGTADYTKITLPGKVKKIKTNLMYSVCLLENGDVYAWGTNTSGQFGNGYTQLVNYPTPQKLNIDNVVEIAAGNGFCIFVKTNKEVYASGKNEFGQLGNGNTISTTEFIRCVELEK